MELKVEVDDDFVLENAVCNFGFFMLCPNKWNPSTKSLERPLRIADGSSSVTVCISQSSSENCLLIKIQNVDALDEADQEAIKMQVIRMLRITKNDDENVRKFQKNHVEARNKGFGRLFRSPDLFEDIVKTMLLRNLIWQRTVQMCEALCELQADHINEEQDYQLPISFFRKRKKESASIPGKRLRKTVTSESRPSVRPKLVGNFPTCKELAGFSEDSLRKRCEFGYRAEWIIKLAQMVENCELKLEEFKGQDLKYSESLKLLERLQLIKGIGPFAAANIAMCLGEYRHIPIDIETIIHLEKVHEKVVDEEGKTKKKIDKAYIKIAKQVYDKYEPYQCLAYRWELCEFYERELGEKMSLMSPSRYQQVSEIYLAHMANKKKEEALRKEAADRANE